MQFGEVSSVTLLCGPQSTEAHALVTFASVEECNNAKAARDIRVKAKLQQQQQEQPPPPPPPRQQEQQQPPPQQQQPQPAEEEDEEDMAGQGDNSGSTSDTVGQQERPKSSTAAESGQAEQPPAAAAVKQENSETAYAEQKPQLAAQPAAQPVAAQTQASGTTGAREERVHRTNAMQASTTRFIKHAEQHMRACGISVPIVNEPPGSSAMPAPPYHEVPGNGAPALLPNGSSPRADHDGAIWSEVETARLVEAAAHFHCRQWSQIAKLVGNRTEDACRHRYRTVVRHEPEKIEMARLMMATKAHMAASSARAAATAKGSAGGAAAAGGGVKRSHAASSQQPSKSAKRAHAAPWAAGATGTSKPRVKLVIKSAKGPSRPRQQPSQPQEQPRQQQQRSTAAATAAAAAERPLSPIEVLVPKSSRSGRQIKSNRPREPPGADGQAQLLRSRQQPGPALDGVDSLYDTGGAAFRRQPAFGRGRWTGRRAGAGSGSDGTAAATTGRAAGDRAAR
eukprot:SAG22_NODE_163_length_16829_cov_9.946204_7_plen_509_part_00